MFQHEQTIWFSEHLSALAARPFNHAFGVSRFNIWPLKNMLAHAMLTPHNKSVKQMLESSAVLFKFHHGTAYLVR